MLFNLILFKTKYINFLHCLKELELDRTLTLVDLLKRPPVYKAMVHLFCLTSGPFERLLRLRCSSVSSTHVVHMMILDT